MDIDEEQERPGGRRGSRALPSGVAGWRGAPSRRWCKATSRRAAAGVWTLLLLVSISALAGAFGACASPAAPESTSTEQTIALGQDLSFLTLGPGDTVALSLHGVEGFTTPPEGARITPAGNLILPLIGPVHVAGLTEEAAYARLSDELSRYYRAPRLSFSVLNRSSKQFYLLGEVTQPGPKPLDRALTALEALSLGEGLTPGANRDRIALIRRHPDGGVEVHLFPEATPDAEGLVQVLPGDLLFVAQTGAGRFKDQVVPYLQGVGFTTSQIASVIIVADRL